MKTWKELLAEKKALSTSEKEKVEPQTTEGNKKTLKELLAELAKQKQKIPISTEEKEEKKKEEKKESFALVVEYDKDQQMAIELAKAGKSFCLIGAAGSGKTTVERAIVQALLENMDQEERKPTHIFRVQGTAQKIEAPALAVVAYTRIASGNSRKAITKDPILKERVFHNITTIHNLLEYRPTFFWDETKQKETMRFIPNRTSSDPLTTRTILFEEASMNDLILWEKVYDAMASNTQVIFIGDINQLPPVFGVSILNIALVQLPIVELRTIYRQASDSSVLANAHRILKGDMVECDKDFQILEGDNLQHGQYKMSQIIRNSMAKWHKTGEYNPETDIFLSPFNEQPLGTTNLNNNIAQLVNNKAVVWEIIAGVRKFYLAVGDKIMYNKQVGIVTRICPNGLYAGSKKPKHPSVHLSRSGVMMANDSLDDLDTDEDDGLANFKIDLDSLNKEDVEELSRQSSAIIDIKLTDTEEELSLSKTGEMASTVFSLAYALTVHKAQGCEWRKVFLILHKDHSVMAFRELLYTAVTRAQEQVVIIGKKFMVEKAIKTPRAKGNTVQEKIEYFNANMTINGVNCVKY